jgi:hypothetical protein
MGFTEINGQILAIDRRKPDESSRTDEEIEDLGRRLNVLLADIDPRALLLVIVQLLVDGKAKVSAQDPRPIPLMRQPIFFDARNCTSGKAMVAVRFRSYSAGR